MLGVVLAAVCLGSCRGDGPGVQPGEADVRNGDRSAYEVCGGEDGHAMRDERLACNRVTRFSLCERGSLVSTAESPLGARARWRVPGTLESIARDITLSYQDAGSYELIHGDYLDLFGFFWGCLVTADAGWAELVFVDGRAPGNDWEDEQEEQQCLVTIVRLGEEDV